MGIKSFTDNFLQSDFVRKNLYTHLQLGFPMPVPYENGIAIRCFFHKLNCNEQQITLSQPKFEIRLAYPSGKIIYFSEVVDKKYQTPEVIITKKRADNFEYTFEQMYAACDEVIDFYSEYFKVTDVVYKKYYKHLERLSTGIGMSDWYGGLYD